MALVRAEIDCQTEFTDGCSLSGCSAPVHRSAADGGVSDVHGGARDGSVAPSRMEGIVEDVSRTFLYSLAQNDRLTHPVSLSESCFVSTVLFFSHP